MYKRQVERDYKMEFQAQELWKWRTNPPDVSFVIGSCSYVNEPQFDRPGEPYGSNFEIFNSINMKSPDFMLWLGDNTYLRESDWNSRTGFIKRYSHTRALSELPCAAIRIFFEEISGSIFSLKKGITLS